jgi:hypothetical protein
MAEVCHLQQTAVRLLECMCGACRCGAADVALLAAIKAMNLQQLLCTLAKVL